jgi:ACR3 family arsenite efflux pump ArsB
VLRRFLTKQHQASWKNGDVRRRSFSLQVMLWALWTLVVAVVAYFNWRADVIAGRPINTLGLVIHCVVAGVIGLVVLTIIEMYLEPWRFIDKR